MHKTILSLILLGLLSPFQAQANTITYSHYRGAEFSITYLPNSFETITAGYYRWKETGSIKASIQGVEYLGWGWGGGNSYHASYPGSSESTFQHYLSGQIIDESHVAIGKFQFRGSCKRYGMGELTSHFPSNPTTAFSSYCSPGEAVSGETLFIVDFFDGTRLSSNGDTGRIQVSNVPLPASAAFLFSAFAATGLLRRRHRAQQLRPARVALHTR